jgi:hypothetical protein
MYWLCTLSPANEEDTEGDKSASSKTADSGDAAVDSSSSTAEQAISEQLDAAKDRRQHLQQQQHDTHHTTSTDTDTDTTQQQQQQQQKQHKQQCTADEKDVELPLEDEDEECDVADDVSCSGESPTDRCDTEQQQQQQQGSAMAAAHSEVQTEHTTTEHANGPYHHSS